MEAYTLSTRGDSSQGMGVAFRTRGTSPTSAQGLNPSVS